MCTGAKCSFFGPQKGNKIPNHLQMPWDTCRPLSTSIMSSASPGHENKRLQNTTRHTITGALEITYIQMLSLNTLNSACEHKSIFKNKSWEVNRTWSIKMELHYPLFHHSTTCIYSQENKIKQNQWYILLKMQPILPFDKANTSALSKCSSFSASCWIPLLKISIILQSRVSNKLFWQTAVDPIQENTSTNYQSF